MKNRKATPQAGRFLRRDTSDEALVALAARGSEDACAEFYDRYGHVAYALALRIVADARLAEAAVENAFTTLWRTSGLAASGSRASTWILTLVHRHAVASLRGMQGAGRARAPLDGRPRTGADGLVGAQRECAESALDQLPIVEQELLILAYFDGLTVPELAARFGQPLRAINEMLHAALDRLGEASAEEAAPSGTSA